MTKPLTETMLECMGTRGDRLRYDSATEEFGVEAHEGFLRTYFKPQPAIHGFESNLAYFTYECLAH